jgi:uncharacterized protein (TIGR02001 family)
MAALAICTMCLAAPAHTADWSAEIGAVSDYRYRGLSLSNGKPALQGSLALEHESGAYAELWASSPSSGGSGPAELDATAGYAFRLTDAVSLDVSATYYAFPGMTEANAVELTGMLEAGSGPFALNLGISLAPPQLGTRDAIGVKKTNRYVFAAAAYDLSSAPVTLRASLGHERGPWDMAAGGGKWDWSLGAEAHLKPVRIGLDLVGSNAGDESLVGALILPF